MAFSGVILITGVASYWGSALANELLAQDQAHVIGIDQEPPVDLNPNLDYIQVDIRNPALTDLLKAEKVQTVCHLDFKEQSQAEGSTYDYNVKGSINLVRSCDKAGVNQVILKSSTATYGARPSNPSFIEENYPLHGSRTSTYVSEMVTLEKYCSALSQHTQGIKFTILRFAHIIAPHAGSPLIRYLTKHNPVTLLGFNPLIQIIYEKDVVGALSFAVRCEHEGVYNIAPDGILPLHKIVGLSGKMRLPVIHPFAYWSASLQPDLKDLFLLGDPNYLRFACVGDLTRMKEKLGFSPQYSPEQALTELKDYLAKIRNSAEESFPSQEEERLRAMIIERQSTNERSLSNIEAESISQEGV